MTVTVDEIVDAGMSAHILFSIQYKKFLVLPHIGQLPSDDPEYVRLVSLISNLWEEAKAKAAIAVNTELLDANWKTGQYIVEFEQGGNPKAKYGEFKHN